MMPGRKFVCVTSTNTIAMKAKGSTVDRLRFPSSVAASLSATPAKTQEKIEATTLKSTNPESQLLRASHTATNHTRHHVVHEYHDRAQQCMDMGQGRPYRIANALFPAKLHYVLDDAKRNGWEDIISWAPHGRSFAVHNPSKFVAEIMPKYFNQSKLTSFQRQLNLYGFIRLTRGPDRGSYYHEYFLRGMPALADHNMVRVKVKGTGIKAASSPQQEPNFYALPLIHVPNASDCDVTLQAAKITSSDADWDVILPTLSSNDLWAMDAPIGQIQLSSSTSSIKQNQTAVVVDADDDEDDALNLFDFMSDTDELMGFMINKMLEAP